MAASEKQRIYWQSSLRLTGGLLIVWLLVTVLSVWFAGELNRYTFFGFPLGFYMGAQGALIIYLLIIWYYNRTMNRRDAAAGVIEDDDE